MMKTASTKPRCEPARGSARKTYAIVLSALLALTATTCAASFIDGRMNAAAIAFAKPSLVALIFMHLRYSRRLMAVVAAAGLFRPGILITLTMGDYLTRGRQ